MSTTTPPGPTAEIPLPQVELIETDGEPLESDWHRIAINLLIDSVRSHLAGRTDYYVGGNMFVYYSEEQARNRDFRGPDFFFVRGVTLEPMRPYWAVWKEGGRYPDVIIELLSPTTAEVDRTIKRDLYAQIFRTREYYCYDPDTRQLEGWHGGARDSEPIAPGDGGRLWCAELGLWLGTWDGVFQDHAATWLRFYRPDGSVVPVIAEAALARVEAAEREARLQRHAAERQRREADAQRQRAEAERQRADAEQQRAGALEAEIARLKAELAARPGPPTP